MSRLAPDRAADRAPPADDRIGNRDEPVGEPGGQAVSGGRVERSTRVVVGEISNALVILARVNTLRYSVASSCPAAQAFTRADPPGLMISAVTLVSISQPIKAQHPDRYHGPGSGPGRRHSSSP